MITFTNANENKTIQSNRLLNIFTIRTRNLDQRLSNFFTHCLRQRAIQEHFTRTRLWTRRVALANNIRITMTGVWSRSTALINKNNKLQMKCGGKGLERDINNKRLIVITIKHRM